MRLSHRQRFFPSTFIFLTFVAVILVAGPARAQLVGEPAPSAGGSADEPIKVDGHSHLVVMQYMSWFGLKTQINFQHAEAVPILQSPDMKSVGGGYDSMDPAIIRQHVKWLEYMGVDAALVDVSNNVGCIFSPDPTSPKFCPPGSTWAFWSSNWNILQNTGHLYSAWSQLKTRLKLIPELGCLDNQDLAEHEDGKTGVEKEADWFGRRMAEYPNMNVEYLGKPLMLVYMGPWPTQSTCSISSLMEVLHKSGLDQKYTFRIDSGFLDLQPIYWSNPNETPTGPIEMAPTYHYWSWVDQDKPSYFYYPTYNQSPLAEHDKFRVENLTAAIATGSGGPDGWGCPTSKQIYCPNDSLRYGDGGGYATLARFMTAADRLDPIFLIVHQFNEFNQPDEGWNAESSDDIEPTQAPGGWEYTAVQAVHDEIVKYRSVHP